MLTRAFQWCLYVAAACLAAAAIFGLMSYVSVSIAVGNSGLKPELAQSFRAHWLGSALQSLLLAGLLALAGWRPGSISRSAIVFCGLLPIASAALFFTLVGSGWGQALSGIAAAAVLLGALLWPGK